MHTRQYAMFSAANYNRAIRFLNKYQWITYKFSGRRLMHIGIIKLRFDVVLRLIDGRPRAGGAARRLGPIPRRIRARLVRVFAV